MVGVGSRKTSFQLTLKNQGIEFKRVEIDEYRPDLTKFDAMLRQMSLLSQEQEQQHQDQKAVTVDEGVAEQEFVVVGNS